MQMMKYLVHISNNGIRVSLYEPYLSPLNISIVY